MPVPVAEMAKLFPLDALRPETREQLAAVATAIIYQRKEVLFRAGYIDEDTIYLTEGELRAKFAGLADAVLGEERAAQLADAVLAIDRANDVASIIRVSTPLAAVRMAGE